MIVTKILVNWQRTLQTENLVEVFNASVEKLPYSLVSKVL